MPRGRPVGSGHCVRRSARAGPPADAGRRRDVGGRRSCPSPVSSRWRSPPPTARCTQGASRAASSAATTAATPGGRSTRCSSFPRGRRGASRRGPGRRTSGGSRRAHTTPTSSWSGSSWAGSCARPTAARPGRTTAPARSPTSTRSPGTRASRAGPTKPAAADRPGATTAVRAGTRPTTAATGTTRGRWRPIRLIRTSGS